MSQRRAAGTWPSPISVELVTASVVRIGSLQVSKGLDGREVIWWDEQRPEEAGRTQIVRRSADGRVTDVLPDGWSARSRVNEYGGGAWWVDAETVFFVSDADQRLWRLDPGFEPVALTPEPNLLRGVRFADGIMSGDRRWIVCVAEIHSGEDLHPGDRHGSVCRLVCVPATGGPITVLVDDADFVTSPRLHPSTGLLAYITWDHPDMPWDRTRLWVAALETGGLLPRLVGIQLVAGGPDESIMDPDWDQAGCLWFVSDRTDWWNLMRFEAPGRPIGEPVVVDERAAEMAGPHWVFGNRRWVTLSDGRVVVATSRAAQDRLVVIDPIAGGAHQVDLDVTTVGPIAASETTLVVVSSTFRAERQIQATLVGRAGKASRSQVLRSPRELGVSTAWFSQGAHISYPTADGEVAHAVFYPPKNPDTEPLPEERVPVVAMIHGGPTSSAQSELKLAVQFWTTRGFAVVDVNHRGSTTYGRSYRQLLRGKWGIADVEDCAAAVAYLADSGHVDRERAVIRGGSAGGFTTLAALAGTDAFAAGASYYGVADLAVLAAETHSFESRYLDGLVAPWPSGAEEYRRRSPLFAVDHIDVPVILFHGTEDAVVPPNQSTMIADALRFRGIPHSLVLIEGEGHGFRRAEAIRRTLLAEWAFYVHVLEIPHDGDLPHVEIWRP